MRIADGALHPVGIALGRGPPRQPESEEYDGAGRDIGQVVDGIAEQSHRAGQHGQEQLDEARGRQAGGADCDGPVRLAPVLRVVSGAGQRKSRSWIALPQGLMHPARMSRARPPGKSRSIGHAAGTCTAAEAAGLTWRIAWFTW